jgi:hypothetical protein
MEKTMNWEAVGAVGEIVGAVAVVATLIYLARQMNQNSSALRSTTAQRANEMAISVYNPIAANEDGLAELLLRGLQDPKALSDLEMARFTAHWQSSFFTWQNWFYQYKTGEFDDGIFLGFSRLFTEVLRTPGLQDYWSHRRQYFSDEFRDFLEIKMLSTEAHTGYRVLGTPSQEENSVSERI